MTEPAPDTILLDLFRTNQLRERLIEASRIVYVSCNPTTLAGNVKELGKEWGYRLERVRPVDMFPHTPHVEAVALLTRS